MQKVHFVRQTVYMLVVVLLVAGLPVQTSAQGPTLPPLPAAPEPIDPDAKAVFTWSVPERYDQSWAAWNQDTASYNQDFVNPKFWSITLDACKSSAVYHIDRYTFTIKGSVFIDYVGTITDFNQTYESTSCRYQVKKKLPRLGKYSVELTIHTRLGASMPFKDDSVDVQDWLIAVIGDSFASGEGNPDTLGNYEVHYTYVDLGVARWERNDSATPLNNQVAQWKDERCHRSGKSAYALLAKDVETRDPHSSVTFISFACTGANLENLINTPYKGYSYKDGQPLLPAQINALEGLVGRTTDRGGRRIDALLMTGGINNLDFSGIIDDCSSNFNAASDSSSCVHQSRSVDIVTHLRSTGPISYKALADRLTHSTLDLGEVYILDYPDGIFSNGGCGLLGQDAIGITRHEGGVIQDVGEALNTAIEDAAIKYNWNYMARNNVTELLRPHPYCVPLVIHIGPLSMTFYTHHDSYFVSNEESWFRQGNEKGTAHPNEAGHRAIAQLLLPVVVLKKSSPYRHIKLIIDAVRIPRKPGISSQVISLPTPGGGGGSNEGYKITVYVFKSSDPRAPSVEVSVSQILSATGEFEPLPPDKFSFDLDIFQPPVPPRLLTLLSFYVGGPFDTTLGATHTEADNYGDGHIFQLDHPTGYLSVKYHVEVSPPPGDPPRLCCL